MDKNTEKLKYNDAEAGNNINSKSYIAQGAVVCGNVTIGEESSIWYNAVVRGDDININIGSHTNIQDNCVVHADPGDEVVIGDYVTIGHGAIVHGCTIGDNTLIGMGAIILNGAVIGKNCIIGAGTVVTEGKIIEDNSLVVGTPGRFVRTIAQEDALRITDNALHYCEEAKKYL